MLGYTSCIPEAVPMYNLVVAIVEHHNSVSILILAAANSVFDDYLRDFIFLSQVYLPPGLNEGKKIVCEVS